MGNRLRICWQTLYRISENQLGYTVPLSHTTYMRFSIMLGAVSFEIWQKSLKLRKRHLTWVKDHSRSLSLSPIDFLLVVNNNRGRISHGFGATVTWSKSRLWHVSLDAIARGVPWRICWWTLYAKKLTGYIVLPDSAKGIILSVYSLLQRATNQALYMLRQIRTSVCLSVRHTPVLYQKQGTQRDAVFTIE